MARKKTKKVLKKTKGRKGSYRTTSATFAENLRNEYDLTTKEAQDIFSIFLDTMEQSLVEGRDIVFNNIGTIQINKEDEKLSRMPNPPQDILLSPRRHLRFKPSSNILEKINEGSGYERTYKPISKEEAEQYRKKR